MARTQTEVVGFIENLQKGLAKVRKELQAAGFDPAVIDANLGQAVRECAEANARQEAMKRDLKAQTTKVVALTRKAWAMASGYLDAGIAAVGKGSDEAKNLQRLRSRIRLPADGTEATAVEPLPEATQ